MEDEISIPPIEKYGNIFIHANGEMAYLSGAKALVSFEKSAKDIFAIPAQKPQEIEVTGTSGPVKMVQWGDNNNFPSDLREKVNPSVETSSNLLFNILTTFGDGIKPVMVVIIGTTKKFVDIEVYEVVVLHLIDKETNEEIKKVLQGQLNEFRKSKEEIVTFFEENNLARYFLEQCTDLHWFFNVFPELVSNRVKFIHLVPYIKETESLRIAGILSNEFLSELITGSDQSVKPLVEYACAHWAWERMVAPRVENPANRSESFLLHEKRLLYATIDDLHARKLGEAYMLKALSYLNDHLDLYPTYKEYAYEEPYENSEENGFFITYTKRARRLRLLPFKLKYAIHIWFSGCISHMADEHPLCFNTTKVSSNPGRQNPAKALIDLVPVITKGNPTKNRALYATAAWDVFDATTCLTVPPGSKPWGKRLPIPGFSK